MKAREQARQSSRSIKTALRKFLKSPGFQKEDIEEFNIGYKRLVSPLISFFCSTSAIEKWRSITTLGWVVCRLALENLEDARVVIRRLMWQLNDESGGIGWGCPEAMGEILRCNGKLADEFSHILISYVDPNGNMLDNESLVEGALWGLARLAEKDPVVCGRGKEIYKLYVNHERPLVRLYSALILGFINEGSDIPEVESVFSDTTQVGFYWEGEIIFTRVCDVVTRFSR